MHTYVHTYGHVYIPDTGTSAATEDDTVLLKSLVTVKLLADVTAGAFFTTA